MNKLSSWFFNTVYLSNDWSTVIKIPQLTTKLINETEKTLKYALKVHQEYFWDALPHTNIKTWKKSPRGYYTEQEFIQWTPLYSHDLNEALQKEFDYLLQMWMTMEKDKKLFFDLYGRNWFLYNSRQLISSSPSIFYSNYILTPEQKIKYIDIWNLPIKNPLVRSAKVIRDTIYNKHTWKSIQKNLP
jgi:hypothetical protein